MSVAPVTAELFRRHPDNPLLTAADWPIPVNVVFNPAAVEIDGETVLLARVEGRTGISHLTVARSANGVDGWTIDEEPLLAPIEGVEGEQWGFEDARVVWVDELERMLAGRVMADAAVPDDPGLGRMEVAARGVDA